MQRTIQRRRVNPFLLLLVSIGAVIAFMWLLSRFIMNLPQTVTQQIVIMMMTTGIFITVLSYGIYRSGALYRLHSLRWLLLLLVVIPVGVVLLNLWQLSQMILVSSLYFAIFTTMMFFAGLTAIGFGYFVSLAITERLSRLADAAGHVARGDFSTRLDVYGNDEIAQLTRSFNAMASDLEEVDIQKRQLEQTRRDLIAWVSHDLRTPLTTMRVMLEALADGVITDEETQGRYVNNTLSEIEHLSHLINDLFELAQLDVGGIQLDFYPTPIADLLSDTIGGLQVKAKRKNISLTGDVEEGIDLVHVAPDKIQRVLKNLIDNAIKYTPNGEQVAIRVCRRSDNLLQIDVHNTGVHIDQDVLPNLFESFYRGDSSRVSNDNERGAGLGLAIARGFVQAHGGTIWAESSPQSGTTFSFTLPNNPPD